MYPYNAASWSIFGGGPLITLHPGAHLGGGTFPDPLITLHPGAHLGGGYRITLHPGGHLGGVPYIYPIQTDVCVSASSS